MYCLNNRVLIFLDCQELVEQQMRKITSCPFCFQWFEWFSFFLRCPIATITGMCLSCCPWLAMPNVCYTDSPSSPQHVLKYFATTRKGIHPTIPENTATLALHSSNIIAKYSSIHIENFLPSHFIESQNGSGWKTCMGARGCSSIASPTP